MVKVERLAYDTFSHTGTMPLTAVYTVEAGAKKFVWAEPSTILSIRQNTLKQLMVSILISQGQTDTLLT